MTYDPQTVINRYQSMLLLPDGEPTESSCALAHDGEPKFDTVGCEPGGCQSCCLGVVELVRQYSEQQATLETRSIEMVDTVTKANHLTRQ